MSQPTVQCPNCFTRSPVADPPVAVVCPGCEHRFTPVADPPARKNPTVPLARRLPADGSRPEADGPHPSRREGDPHPRPGRRSDGDRRSRWEDDDEPPPRRGSGVPLVLIAGGVLAALTLAGVVTVAVALFAKPSAPTGPLAVAPPTPADVTEPRWNDPGPAFDPNIEPDPPGVPAPPAIPGPPGGPMPMFDPQPENGEPARVIAPVPKLPGEPATPNSNALVTKHRAKLRATASSEWQGGWPVAKLFDGIETTSWYSHDPDNTLTQKYPVVTVTFPEDVTVKRVTILGNRDPEYPRGYTVQEGTVELLDGNGKVLAKHDVKGAGEKSDFDLVLKNVPARAVRFTMTKSERGECGLGEFLVE